MHMMLFAMKKENEFICLVFILTINCFYKAIS